jgi:hypothetical protein
MSHGERPRASGGENGIFLSRYNWHFEVSEMHEVASTNHSSPSEVPAKKLRGPVVSVNLGDSKSPLLKTGDTISLKPCTDNVYNPADIMELDGKTHSRAVGPLTKDPKVSIVSLRSDKIERTN